jgi:hypothetical protein
MEKGQILVLFIHFNAMRSRSHSLSLFGCDSWVSWLAHLYIVAHIPPRPYSLLKREVCLHLAPEELPAYCQVSIAGLNDAKYQARDC